MKIALLGYGKMGRAIEKIALDRGHEIVLKIQKHNLKDLSFDKLQIADVAIDFSIPDSAKSNILLSIKANTPIISGTTGWLDNYDEVVQKCIEEKSAFLYASNFSLGVNLFFELNKRLAHLMQPYSQYNVNLTEIHHTEKLDAPSGTAISLAEQIITENNSKNDWTLDKQLSNDKIVITSERQGKVPGTHIINYESTIDSISIKHEAHSREGFALGAVIAAEWIQNKQGVFSMHDVLFSS